MTLHLLTLTTNLTPVVAMARTVHVVQSPPDHVIPPGPPTALAAGRRFVLQDSTAICTLEGDVSQMLMMPSSYKTETTLVRTRIGEKVRGVRRVRIRFVPAETEDVEDEFISPSVSARSSPGEAVGEQNGHVHDHDHGHGHAHANGTAHANGGANGVTKRR